MANYKSGRIWHSSPAACEEAMRRLQTPLHYHLRRHDYVAFQTELRNGTNPSEVDECGRSPLDLAIDMFEDIVETSLCTSFAVDFIQATLEYDARHPSKFTHDTYKRAYANMNDHMHFTDPMLGHSTGEGRQKFAPETYPLYKHDILPGHISRKLNSGRSEKPSSRKDVIKQLTQLDVGMPDSIEVSPEDGPFRPQDSNMVERLYQDNMVMVVEDAMQQPTKKTVRNRMNELNSQMRALLRIIRLLAGWPPLLRAAMHRKALLADALVDDGAMHRSSGENDEGSSDDDDDNLMSSTRRHHSASSSAAAAAAAGGILLPTLSFPFLYMSALQILYEQYPRTPIATRWRHGSVVDARRLIHLTISKRLRGYEIFVFLSETLRLVSSYFDVFGRNAFNPRDPQLEQYMLHMAFCLDCPKLFSSILRYGDPFADADQFDWSELGDFVTKRPHIGSFAVDILQAKLRGRLQQRLGGDEGREQRRADDGASIPTPFEERHLTRNVISDYEHVYGGSDTAALEQYVDRWPMDVARRCL